VWTSVTDTRLQSKLSHWSVAAAVFGASCNLSFLILTLYQDASFSWQPNDWGNLLLFTAIILAPSLVLFAFRHYFAVVFIYASTLFSILVWRIEYPHGYDAAGKYDDVVVVPIFLGLISAAVVSVWVTIRFVIFMWRVLKSK